MKKNYGISYRFGEHRVTIEPYFLYEISVYKLEKNSASILGSKYYKTKEFLKIKNDEVILKKTKDYSIVKMIDLVGVTQEFLEENNLEIYEPRKPIKKVKEQPKKVTFTLKRRKRK